MKIAGRKIGPGEKTYIVAELSANHGQDFDQAVAIIRAAKEAGTDAVKIQTYTADTLTIKAPQEYFRVGPGTLWSGRTLHDLYEEAYTPWEWQPKLQRIANDIGLPLFSTPFDDTSVDFLEKMNVPAYKIASFELIDIPLLKKVAATKKPVILSTGMATLGEIEEAVQTLRDGGAPEIALLKCTSAYPAPAEDMNLHTIPHLAKAFGVITGLSDHTLGITVPIAAVAVGACIIEKHMTLSRATPGPDSAFSLEPHEFKAMVDAVRITEKALGQVHYGTSPEDAKSRIFRRSLFVVRDIKSGEKFTPKNIRSIHPAHGLPPRHLPNVLGKKANRDLVKGTPLAWEMVGS